MMTELVIIQSRTFLIQSNKMHRQISFLILNFSGCPRPPQHNTV